jgi:hypothetical protein
MAAGLEPSWGLVFGCFFVGFCLFTVQYLAEVETAEATVLKRDHSVRGGRGSSVHTVWWYELQMDEEKKPVFILLESEKKPPKVEPGTRVKIQYKKAFWVDVVAVTVADQNLKARPPLFLD